MNFIANEEEGPYSLLLFETPPQMEDGTIVAQAAKIRPGDKGYFSAAELRGFVGGDFEFLPTRSVTGATLVVNANGHMLQMKTNYTASLAWGTGNFLVGRAVLLHPKHDYIHEPNQED